MGHAIMSDGLMSFSILLPCPLPFYGSKARDTEKLVFSFPPPSPSTSAPSAVGCPLSSPSALLTRFALPPFTSGLLF